MCKRLRVPNHFKVLALHVTQYHTHCHRVNELRATTLVDLLQTLGAFKDKNTLREFVLACESDMRGRLTFENALYPQAEMLLRLANAAANVDTSIVLNSGLQGAKIGEAIRRLRIQAIAECRLSNQV
jgi:tRNA nucleotidyltransferase (CCA-adding enzyme)